MAASNRTRREPDRRPKSLGDARTESVSRQGVVPRHAVGQFVEHRAAPRPHGLDPQSRDRPAQADCRDRVLRLLGRRKDGGAMARRHPRPLADRERKPLRGGHDIRRGRLTHPDQSGHRRAPALLRLQSTQSLRMRKRPKRPLARRAGRQPHPQNARNSAELNSPATRPKTLPAIRTTNAALAGLRRRKRAEIAAGTPSASSRGCAMDGSTPRRRPTSERNLLMNNSCHSSALASLYNLSPLVTSKRCTSSGSIYTPTTELLAALNLSRTTATTSTPPRRPNRCVSAPVGSTRSTCNLIDEAGSILTASGLTPATTGAADRRLVVGSGSTVPSLARKAGAPSVRTC